MNKTLCLFLTFCLIIGCTETAPYESNSDEKPSSEFIENEAVNPYLERMKKIKNHPKISQDVVKEAEAISGDERVTVLIFLDTPRVGPPEQLKQDKTLSSRDRLERLRRDNLETAEMEDYAIKVKAAQAETLKRIDETAAKLEELTGDRPQIFTTASTLSTEVTIEELEEISDWDYVKQILSNKPYTSP